MTPSYAQSPIAEVLDRLSSYASVEDPRAKQRVQERESEIGQRLATGDRYELYGDNAPLSVSREVGTLLYVLVRAARPSRVVEFGASHGLSTIYIASALRDAGQGSLITTELRLHKANAARANLDAANLADFATVWVGDALETLRSLDAPVEFLFLDGRNDYYLPVLELIEPSLGPNAMIVADLSADDPDLVPYLRHVRARGSNYASSSVPLDAGVEVSIWGSRPAAHGSPLAAAHGSQSETHRPTTKRRR
jgi:predicted O-methyltransferase YrrM